MNNIKLQVGDLTGDLVGGGFFLLIFISMVYCSGILQWCSSQRLQGVNHAPYILHKAAVQQKEEGGQGGVQQMKDNIK